MAAPLTRASGLGIVVSEDDEGMLEVVWVSIRDIPVDVDVNVKQDFVF
jgi:hypothetical protein